MDHYIYVIKQKDLFFLGTALSKEAIETKFKELAGQHSETLLWAVAAQDPQKIDERLREIRKASATYLVRPNWYMDVTNVRITLRIERTVHVLDSLHLSPQAIDPGLTQNKELGVLCCLSSACDKAMGFILKDSAKVVVVTECPRCNPSVTWADIHRAQSKPYRGVS